MGLGLGLAAVKACVWHFVEMQRPSSISLGLGQVFHNWHFYNQDLTRDDVKWVGMQGKGKIRSQSYCVGGVAWNSKGILIVSLSFVVCPTHYSAVETVFVSCVSSLIQKLKTQQENLIPPHDNFLGISQPGHWGSFASKAGSGDWPIHTSPSWSPGLVTSRYNYLRGKDFNV